MQRLNIQKTFNIKNYLVSNKKNFFKTFLVFSLIIVALFGLYIRHTYYIEKRIVNRIKTSPREEINKFDYTIVLVGDSHTEYLGNLEELEYFLDRFYPDKKFLLLNYGYSSTNILSLPERIEKDTFHNNRIYQPINDIDFDLIIIESFGNNPLTQFPLEEGLQKQRETLDYVVKKVTEKHDRSKIVFLATVAPSKKKYGLGEVDLSKEKRREWAQIRSAYILNHIEYAKEHNIPVIDLYHRSLTRFKDGNELYLNKLDYIHPSLTGIFYMDNQISQFIYKNKLLR